MAKLTKDITGCSGDEIYPRTYAAGEECPADLVPAAVALGALPKKIADKITEDAELARQAQEEADLLAAEDAARLAAEGQVASVTTEGGGA